MDTEASHSVPVYRRVARELTERIRAGELSPGSRVPSERELAGGYGISRMTARAAVQLLAQRGLVERRDRSGVFVARPKIEQELNTVAGFYEQLLGHGMVPGSEVIEARLVSVSEVDPEVAAGLGLELDSGAGVYEVVRKRTGNGEPLVLEESYFPQSLFAGLLEEDLSGSLYGVLRDRYGVLPARSRQRIEPTQLDSAAAQALDTRPDVPALRVIRTAWDTADTPIEFARDLYRGDRLVFVAESFSGDGE